MDKNNKSANRLHPRGASGETDYTLNAIKRNATEGPARYGARHWLHRLGGIRLYAYFIPSDQENVQIAREAYLKRVALRNVMRWPDS